MLSRLINLDGRNRQKLAGNYDDKDNDNDNDNVNYDDDEESIGIAW